MADSVFKSILEAVQSEIQGLALTGIDDENVIVLKVFSDREGIIPGLPGVIILPVGAEAIDRAGGSNVRDEIGYPVGIAICAADNSSDEDQAEDFDERLLWRELIRKNFINQKLSGVTGSQTCYVEPQPVVDPFRWLKRNLWVSAMVLRFVVLETRG